MMQFAAGSAAAFETLYRRHELRLWRYLYRHCGNRASADELMQDAWFAVVRAAPSYEPKARFTTWLFTLAHNRMVDGFRARRPLDRAVEGGRDDAMERVAADVGCEPLAVVLRADQVVALMQALDALPDEQREAIVLQLEGDFSVEEIASITRTSFETTKSRLRYARARLRELLKEYA